MGCASEAIILATDRNGCVINCASKSKISASWIEPLNSTVQAYRDQVGADLHSVYVRGSVPLGQARDFVSDLDTFAIVVRLEPSSDVSWALGHSHEVARRWPFVAGVEVAVYPLRAARGTQRVAAMIKVQSACVHGQDLGRDIMGFKPGLELLFHAWDLPRDLFVAKHLLTAPDSQTSVDEICVWIMKRVVRSGFELVMERAGCYTRDLVSCCAMFACYYPARAELMEEALSLAIADRVDRQRCSRVIDGVEDWLYPAICDVYGAARIGQLISNRRECASLDPV